MSIYLSNSAIVLGLRFSPVAGIKCVDRRDEANIA